MAAPVSLAEDEEDLEDVSQPMPNRLQPLKVMLSQKSSIMSHMKMVPNSLSPVNITITLMMEFTNRLCREMSFSRRRINSMMDLVGLLSILVLKERLFYKPERR